MNKYLAKIFYIIEKDSKQKCTLPNDMKLRINVIDKLDADLVMENIAYSEKYICLIYKGDFYKDKQKEIDDLFI